MFFSKSQNDKKDSKRKRRDIGKNNPDFTITLENKETIRGLQIEETEYIGRYIGTIQLKKNQ